MPKDPSIKVYCIQECLKGDGKGGTYKVGQEVECESQTDAQRLLATGRFSEDKPAPKKESPKK